MSAVEYAPMDRTAKTVIFFQRQRNNRSHLLLYSPPLREAAARDDLALAAFPEPPFDPGLLRPRVALRDGAEGHGAPHVPAQLRRPRGDAPGVAGPARSAAHVGKVIVRTFLNGYVD